MGILLYTSYLIGFLLSTGKPVTGTNKLVRHKMTTVCTYTLIGPRLC